MRRGARARRPARRVALRPARPGPRPGTGSLAPTLFDARSVTVRVDGRDVLSGVDFTLRRGERVAVVGPNGAGRSTFLRLLAGDEQPASGAIDRLDLGPRADAFELRGRIGLVSPELQARHRFDATGENVVLSGFEGTIGLAEAPSDDRRAAAARTLARLGIAGLASRHLLALSYGELRKLLLARALAPAPEVLLLDEPLAGMGADEALRMVGLLRRLAPDHAMLLVEHDMDAVFRIADRITVMVNGAVIAHETGHIFGALDQYPGANISCTAVSGYLGLPNQGEKPRLYHNNHDGTFTDVAEKAGVVNGAWTLGTGVGDINNSGFLSMYISNYVGGNKLMLNNGDGTFKDITAESGTSHNGWGKGTSFADTDHSGYLSFYEGDCKFSNQLYHNNGNLTFTDASSAWAGS